VSFWRKFRYLAPWIRRAEDRDIDEELASLRDMAGPGELGNLTLAAEDARGALSWMWLERLRQDVRYAFRSMAHHKGFTLLVVTSLALGIGATSAIYSFMESIMFRSLPVRDPQALVIMKWRAKTYTLAKSGMTWSTSGSAHDPETGTVSSIFPYSALKVFEDADDVLASAFCYFSVNRHAVTAGGETEPVKGHQVSGNYFAGMGVTPAAGRLIQPADDVVGAPGVAVISERLATRRLGGADAAVGQTIRFNDKPLTVVGVVPASFFGAEPGAVPDVYLPMRAEWIFDAAGATAKYADDHFYWLEIMARLKPGVTIAQAQAALAPRFARFVDSTATSDEDRRDLPVLSLEPGATGLDSLRRRYAQPLYILIAMVAMMLLIACSNTANLLLSRAAARRREIAVRLSIGASRGRVVRQLLTESVLLACVGAALGIAIAWWGIRVLTDLLSNGRDNFTLHAELNWSVLGVTILLAVVTGLLFGLAPALQATRVNIVPALKEVRANAAPRRRGRLAVGPALVTGQIVLSVVLLFGAGLFGRTLAKLHAIETGFDRENVLLFTIRPFTLGYQGPQLIRLFEEIRLAAGRLPGVESASMSTAPLPMGGGTQAPVRLLGAEAATDAGGKPPRAVLASVGPSFFTTMRIAIEGRDFSEEDAAGAQKVVIVNRRMAQAFGVTNPIGRTLQLGADQFEVVGLAADALSFTLKEGLRASVYFPYLQSARPSINMTYEIRTSGDPLDLATGIRRVVKEIDPRLAIHEIKTQAAHIDQTISSEITLARLCSVFAALALVIACIGLYGTVAFNVARRTNEIGIRMTLGAQRGRIVWMVLRQVLVLTGAGLAIGVPLALAGSSYVKSLLFGIEPNDPIALAIGIAALLLSGLVAGLVPARRAARIDPMVAVRHE
jgi:macrolide transport system ATP-binding/permease protein